MNPESGERRNIGVCTWRVHGAFDTRTKILSLQPLMRRLHAQTWKTKSLAANSSVSAACSRPPQGVRSGISNAVEGHPADKRTELPKACRPPKLRLRLYRRQACGFKASGEGRARGCLEPCGCQILNRARVAEVRIGDLDRSMGRDAKKDAKHRQKFTYGDKLFRGRIRRTKEQRGAGSCCI